MNDISLKIEDFCKKVNNELNVSILNHGETPFKKIRKKRFNQYSKDYDFTDKQLNHIKQNILKL